MLSRPLTYGDFLRTGVQDCGNALSYDEFEFDSGPAERIVEKAWAGWEAAGMEEQWLAQQDDLEGLDPHKCYESWRNGWKSCATFAIGAEQQRRLDEAEDEHENPPPGWWRRPTPSQDRPCYRTKSEALKRFLDVNYEIVENYGGADYEVSPSEFDAINHKYDLKGKRAARSIAEAVWAAMPVGKPYCLDRIDLDALNDTSPARGAGVEFRLPDAILEARMIEGEARHYAATQDLPEPAWVTEHEPVQVFPPLPQIPEGPMRLRLERREPGVETYRMLPPLPPLEEVRPVRMELEEHGPGVETYKIFSNPCGNPAASWRVWFSDSPGSSVTVDASSALQAMMRAAPQFASGPLFKRARGNMVREMVALPHGETTWRTSRKPVERLVSIEHDGSLAFHPESSRGADVSKNHPIDNPAWVTKIISKHFVALEENVPAKWLPKLTKPTSSYGKIVAAMKEYGCGAYGCVLPTLDPQVVLKLTTDDTEAQFAHELADKLAAPVVVKYHLTRALPEKYKGRSSFLLWRDAADHVGKVEQAISEEGGTDPMVVEAAIGEQHAAAQDAYDALHEGKPAEKLIAKWENAARRMGQKVPELRELAEGMITNLHKNKVFMGDVHGGNIGRVNGRWVVVDPGHVAVLEA